MRTHLRKMAAGKMNPMQAAAVAPVNWKATHMLGMKLAPVNIKLMRITVTKTNLLLLEDKGLAEGKMRPSMLSRRAKKTIGNTSMRWMA